jgi:arylsulfatase A-like enzyme
MIERTRHTHAQDSLSPEAVQVIRAYYYGCVTFLDAMVGRVLDHLRQTGLLEQTVVVFTADHGDLLGDFGSFFKCNHLNGSVRVPFIAAGPGVAEGRISDALVGLQDILPTFAALAGTGLALPCQGLDLTPVLRSPEGAVRDLFYAHTAESPWQSAMVTDGRWKYVYSEPNAVEEFYDQIGDPLEQHNLAVATARSECLDAWRDRLRKAATALGDDHLLDGDGFARSSVDRSAFPRLPVSGMGWRWY